MIPVNFLAGAERKVKRGRFAMSTHVETIASQSRPRHIRYFEFLQFGMIGIVLATEFAAAGEQLLFKLASLGPVVAILLALTLAVSRAHQNWARWVLLIIYIYIVVAGLPFVLLMPGLSLIEILVAVLLAAGLPGAVLSLAFTKQSSAWIRAKNAEKASSSPIGAAISWQQPKRPARAVSAKLIDHRAGLVWALSSGAGASLGAWLACLLLPSARFAENPIGHFTWALVGFASIIGLGFGAAQSAVLAHLLKSAADLQKSKIRLVLLAWVIATAASVFAMVFPLWWTDAEALLIAPGYMLTVMTPGIVLLAVLQWTLIRLCSPLEGWLWRTAVGGAIGASMGLFTAMFIRAVLPLPMEAVWAGSFGLVIGAMQAKLIGELHAPMNASPPREPAFDRSIFREPPPSMPMR